MRDQLPCFKKQESLHWSAVLHSEMPQNILPFIPYWGGGGVGNVPFYFQPPTFYFALPPRPPSFSGKCILIYLVSKTVLVVFATHWLLWIHCIHLSCGWYTVLWDNYIHQFENSVKEVTLHQCVYFQPRYHHL